MYLFVHTKHSQKAGPFSVARLKMDCPFHNPLAHNRVHRTSASPIEGGREGGDEQDDARLDLGDAGVAGRPGAVSRIPRVGRQPLAVLSLHVPADPIRTVRIRRNPEALIRPPPPPPAVRLGPRSRSTALCGVHDIHDIHCAVVGLTMPGLPEPRTRAPFERSRSCGHTANGVIGTPLAALPAIGLGSVQVFPLSENAPAKVSAIRFNAESGKHSTSCVGGIAVAVTRRVRLPEWDTCRESRTRFRHSCVG